MCRRRQHQGFTLVELVATIVILGIIGVTISSIVGYGARVFADVTGRDQILSQSRFVLERLNRDLRNALPNSVRVAGNATRQCIEYVPIRWSTYYFDIPTSGESLSNTLEVVRLSSSIENYQFNQAHQVIVYPIDENAVYRATGNRRNRYDLLAVQDGATDRTNLTIDISGNQRFTTDSNARRIYIVDEPESYCVQNGRITFHQGYGFGQQQRTDVGTVGTGVLMAQNLSNTLSPNPDNFNNNTNRDDPFRVLEATLQRNAYVYLFLRFARPENPSETVVFSNEIHVPNVP